MYIDATPSALGDKFETAKPHWSSKHTTINKTQNTHTMPGLVAYQ